MQARKFNQTSILRIWLNNYVVYINLIFDMMIFQYVILGSWRRIKRSLASDLENLNFDMSHLQETEDGAVLVQSSTLSLVVRTLGAVKSKVSDSLF